MFLYFSQAFVTWVLLGLIWVIQLVHYPMFKFVSFDIKAFVFHQRRISLLVVPLMLFELFSAIALLINQWSIFPSIVIINMVIIGCIWLHTFLIMVPLHNKLIQEPNNGIIKRLVNQNWVRTIAWSIKSLLWGGIIWHLITV